MAWITRSLRCGCWGFDMPRLCSFVGETIYAAMVAQQLTICETARRLGISRAYLYRVLSGSGGITPRLAIALGYVLGLDSGLLFRAVAERRMYRARECEHRRIIALSGSRRARPCHADVLALCKLGSQWCHVCREWTCGDNMNPQQPHDAPMPKVLALKSCRGGE